MSTGQDGNYDGVFAQRYQPSGTKLGEEFQVNTHTESLQNAPSVSGLADGGFVISWQDGGDHDGYSFGIFAQRYQADGTKVGEEFQVNTHAISSQWSPAVSSLNNGGFIITWHGSDPDDGYAPDIFAQRYLASGAMDGEEFQVNTYTRDSQYSAAVSGLINGGFVITWNSRDQDGSEFGIFAQHYQADGTRSGEEFQVNTYTIDRQYQPAVSSLNNGGFIIAWQSRDQNGSGLGVFAQRYLADGTADGEEFQVNMNTTSSEWAPAVNSLNDGGFVITWQGAEPGGDSEGVFARRYQANSTPDGAEFRVNTYTANRQWGPVVSKLENDGFVIAWSSYFQDGDANGVFAQRYAQSTVPNEMALSEPLETIYVGDEITLAVEVSGSGLYGIDGVLTLDDSAVLNFTSSEYGDFFANNSSIGPDSSVTDTKWQGALSLLAPAVAQTGSGVFANVSLVAQQVGTVNLTLKALLANQQGGLLLDNSTVYTFTVLQGVTITGNVSAFAINGSYENIRLYINDVLQTINDDGSFTLQTAPGEAVIRVAADGFLPAEKTLQLTDTDVSTELGDIAMIAGDVNGDEVINIADLTMLLAAYRSAITDTDNFNPAADFNRDNQINIQDLTLLGSHFGKTGSQSW